MAEKAVKLDPNDAGCRFVLGHLLAYERRWPESDSEFATALEIDPNYADAWADLSDFSVLSGKPATAIEQVQKALRLNPHPPRRYYWDLGFAQYAARQYELAVVTLRNEATYRTISRRVLAASLAQLGRTDEAHQEGALFMASNPHFTISDWAASQPFRDQARVTISSTDIAKQACHIEREPLNRRHLHDLGWQYDSAFPLTPGGAPASHLDPAVVASMVAPTTCRSLTSLQGDRGPSSATCHDQSLAERRVKFDMTTGQRPWPTSCTR
ncbi:MAG: tetratricopeptide repeat protein [Mesorhizobium sp.]|nr:MAG: tetratricopeptide repeat protein [Mesorhizobium sp.]